MPLLLGKITVICDFWFKHYKTLTPNNVFFLHSLLLPAITKSHSQHAWCWAITDNGWIFSDVVFQLVSSKDARVLKLYQTSAEDRAPPVSKLKASQCRQRFVYIPHEFGQENLHRRKHGIRQLLLSKLVFLGWKTETTWMNRSIYSRTEDTAGSCTVFLLLSNVTYLAWNLLVQNSTYCSLYLLLLNLPDWSWNNSTQNEINVILQIHSRTTKLIALPGPKFSHCYYDQTKYCISDHFTSLIVHLFSRSYEWKRWRQICWIAQQLSCGLKSDSTNVCEFCHHNERLPNSLSTNINNFGGHRINKLLWSGAWSNF